MDPILYQWHQEEPQAFKSIPRYMCSKNTKYSLRVKYEIHVWDKLMEYLYPIYSAAETKLSNVHIS